MHNKTLVNNSSFDSVSYLDTSVRDPTISVEFGQHNKDIGACNPPNPTHTSTHMCKNVGDQKLRSS